MSPSLFDRLLLLAVFMVLAAFYSGIETGLISIPRIRLYKLAKSGNAAARMLKKFLDSPDLMFGTTLTGTNLSLVITSVIAADMARIYLGRGGEAISSVVVTVLLLIFSEYLPKAWFHAVPLERCLRFSRVLQVSGIIFRPVSNAIVAMTRLLVPGASQSMGHADQFASRDEIRMIFRQSGKDGVLTTAKQQMIHGVFELSSQCARDIMIPREQMVCVDAGTGMDAFYELVRNNRFTRYPVYDRAQEKFTGIVNVFQVVSENPQRRSAATVAAFARPLLTVDENMPVDAVLPRMRRLRQPMCLVSGADGRVVGLLTTEDILVEIVGQL
jgi:putative hemolysin